MKKALIWIFIFLIFWISSTFSAWYWLTAKNYTSWTSSTYSWTSTNHTNSSTSCSLDKNLSGGDILSYTISSELNYDFWHLYIDWTEVISMKHSWIGWPYTYIVPSWSHTWHFCYTKDYSVSMWTDSMSTTFNMKSSTSCPTDWDTAWWTPTWYPWDVAVSDTNSLTPNPGYNNYASNSNLTNAITVPASWTMYCMKWDWAIPTITNDYAYDNIWASWAIKTITLSPVDTWWSWISTTKWCVWSTCNPSTWTVWTTITKSAPYNNIIRYQTWDVAWNTSAIWSVTVKLDNKAPVASDILDTTPANNSNLLAKLSQNFQLNISPNWGAPIDIIEWYFEETTTFTPTKFISLTNWVNSFNHDISNVDLYRNFNWSRQYTFIITKVWDLAGNHLNWTKFSPLKTYNYNVYANSIVVDSNNWIPLTEKTAFQAGDVADWTAKSLTITLKDAYWNIIIPASWINRTVDFNFDVNNTTNLNQNKKTWDAVFVSIPSNTTTYTNRLTSSSGFISQPSSDWIYPFSFKVYSPTYSGSVIDGRQYANWNFIINNITYDINWNIWHVNNRSTLNTTGVDFQFKPIYKTTFGWDIKTYWFIEWATQYGTINISKVTWSRTPVTPTLNLEFGSWSQAISNSFDMLLKTPNHTPIWEGNWNYTAINNPNLTIFTWSHIISTLLTQTWGIIGNLSNSYLSSHISYKLDTHNIVYNSDILWKTNYWWSLLTSNTNQVWIKVLWKTFSDKQKNLTTTQQSSNFNILWNISKASIRKDIKVNVFNIIKNVIPNNDANWDTMIKISSLTSIGWNNLDWKRLQNHKILYFWNLVWWNVTLNTLDKVEWKKTIIVEGWNLYIKSNIINKTSNDILWIIVLKDSNWKWWNLYIDPHVTELDAIIYTDRSVVSYDWNVVLDWNASQNLLRDQLYIKGSIFSYNTIWWSRMVPPVCPYYIPKSSCNKIKAQTYDFNYLRRYFLYDTTWNWVWDTPANNWTWVILPTSTNYKYPIVIEYNPIIQTSPPPLFSK